MKPLEFPEFVEEQAYMVSGKTLNAMIKSIRENRILNSPDVHVTQKSDGLLLTIKSKSSSEYPFKIVEVAGGLMIQPGTVANKIPTIGGVGLHSNPVLAIPSSGMCYILIKVHYSYTTNIANTLVLGGTVTSAEIVALTSLPSPSHGSGVGYDHLTFGICLNGSLTHEGYIRRSLSITICDSGLGDGEPILHAGGAG